MSSAAIGGGIETIAAARQSPDRAANGTMILITVVAMLTGGICVIVSDYVQSRETILLHNEVR